METLNKIWNWFDGNKTSIGFFLLWITDKPWLRDLLPDGTVESAIIDIISYIAAILAGTGLLHKGVKVYEERKEKKENEE